MCIVSCMVHWFVVHCQAPSLRGAVLWLTVCIVWYIVHVYSILYGILVCRALSSTFFEGGSVVAYCVYCVVYCAPPLYV
jgi:hypothetical protein